MPDCAPGKLMTGKNRENNETCHPVFGDISYFLAALKVFFNVEEKQWQ